jgi:hypothetical protein
MLLLGQHCAREDVREHFLERKTRLPVCVFCIWLMLLSVRGEA